MRILVAASEWFPDRKGGNARVTAETARRLAERGHEVTVLAPRVPGKPPLATEGALTLRRVIPRRLLPVTFNDLLAGWARGRRFRRSPFDLVVSHASTVSCGLIAAGMRTPLVIVYHAPGPHELRFDRDRLGFGMQRFRTTLITPIVALTERVSVERSTRLLTLSDYTRGLFLADFPHLEPKVRRVRGGVDVAHFCPGAGREEARERVGLQAETPLLLTVRRLEPRMGLENLIEAISRLRSRVPVTLAIGGTGSLESRLRTLVRDLGLAESVRILGALPEDHLVSWYQAADLFVLPSIDFEGFGLVTVEALASGTPVVGTPVGATPELLAPLDVRLLARAADPAALADAVEQALSFADDDLRARCRGYACERFAWGPVMADWEAELVEAAA